MKRMLLLLLCLGILSGCGEAKKNEQYQKALEQMKAGAYEPAAALLQQSIDAKVRLPEAYRAQGICYMKAKDYGAAIASFSRSLNTLSGENPDFKKDVMYYLAQVRADYGQIEEAIGVYTDILNMDPDNYSFFLRGKLYLEKEDYKKAESDFSKALKDCKDYDLYVKIFNVYQSHKMVAKGDEYLKQALAIAPKEAGDHFQRGRVYYYMKDYEGAREELNEAIKEGDPNGVLLLGKVYIAMEDAGSARAMYQQYLNDQKEQAKAYNGLALCDIYEKNYDNALANIQKGLDTNDKEERQSLLLNEVIVYEYKLDFETAKQKLAAYLDAYPDEKAAVRENEFLQSR